MAESLGLHPARARLVVALDVDDADRALVLARRLQPWFGIAKVGLQLFTAAGPDVVARLRAEGFDVFLDLKLHDIPNTVAAAAREAGRQGVRYLTLHASGGAPMLLAGVEGLVEGADLAGLAPPIALGVTVLTSDPEAGSDVLAARVATLVAAGCPGAVCSALDVGEVRRLAPGVLTCCPGIRPAGEATHDQARVATPAGAVAAGADLLVVGRPVTAHPEPERAAARLADEVTHALG